MKYVSLHHHSTYSYMDGYGLPEDHVARAADLGMSAIAMTEHGNVSSHVKTEQAAEKHNIKPIYGLEAYTAPADMRETQNQRKWHLTILAMNQTGYQNLNQLVTRSWKEGFYRWPTVTGAMLKEHNEGLIVLSGCADSKLACDLLGGKGRDKGSERDAIQTLLQFKRIFGDRYYLEVQQFPELARSRQLNEWYETQSRRLGIGLAASSDCHYPFPDDNEMQKILHAAGRNIGTVEAAEASWEYDIRLTLPSSDRAVYDRLRATGLSRKGAEQAILNTAEIADRCNVILPKMERVKYPIEADRDWAPGLSNVDLLRKWLNTGWKYRGIHKLPRKKRIEYQKRVEHELALIVDKDFTDYFLMLSDVVSAVKDKELAVGPARGSAAASLICYLLRITEVDPLNFPMMMFERFIDPNRHDLPDIDLDFDDERRDEVRQHLIQRFGEERVGNIGTFTKYRGKNSMDDVSRVYSIPKFEVEQAKSFLVERSSGDTRFGDTIRDTVEMFPQVNSLFEKYPPMEYTYKLEGNYKGMGVHAAGVVVGAEPLWKVLASYSRQVNGKEYSVMSVDKYDGEYLGLLKVDALGLTTMGMIARAISMIGMSLEELYALPLDDKETIDAFRRADVVGIFQFEGRTTRMVCQEVAPDNFMELADINALSRPGPLHSGQTGTYIAIKHGRGEAEPLHEIIDGLTTTTHGQIIYQEQILAICRQIGQFPWLHAATIRKIISQKKGEAAFNTLYDDFVKGAATIDVGPEQADKIWKNMVTAGSYAFNIAHCISYAMLAYWCMWLKVHHPVAFYAAQLQKKDPNDEDKTLALMRDAMDSRYGRSLKVLGPDPVISGETWSPDFENGSIRAGLRQVKGIGEKTAKAMIDYRNENKVEDWSDYIAVKGIGPKTMEKVREFADSPDPFGILKIQNSYDEIKDFIRSWNKDEPNPYERLPLPDTYAEEIPYEAVRSKHNMVAMIKAKNPQELFENHMSRTGEPLDPSTVKDPHLKDYMTLYCEDPSGLATIKVDRWKYPKFKNQLINARTGRDWIIAKVHKKPFYGKTVHVDDLWVVDPEG